MNEYEDVIMNFMNEHKRISLPILERKMREQMEGWEYDRALSELIDTNKLDTKYENRIVFVVLGAAK